MINTYSTLDLALVIVANIINLVLCLIFLNRVFGHSGWEKALGYGTIVMIFPLVIVSVLNLAGGREWAFWILPLVMVLYLMIEFLLDYVLKWDFRKTPMLGPYLMLYYVALFALIGYAFLVGRPYGFITLITYFINLAATFYSLRRVGHGSHEVKKPAAPSTGNL